ncbi:MAG: (2Fe-2S)-binding protein [Alphaproteobacteria bacterium]|nr:(2Fe-2S)-binding protein [Alphaproteobacteria bacterium]
MIVCVCNSLRDNDIRRAAESGATSVIDAYARLGTAPQCGCCLECAQDMIDAHHEDAREPVAA